MDLGIQLSDIETQENLVETIHVSSTILTVKYVVKHDSISKD